MLWQRRTSLLALVLLLSIIPYSITIAGELIIPKTFSDGDTLQAKDLNNNFTAAKGAVDDNHTRIANTGTRFFEAEGQIAENVVTGTVADDASASGGQVRFGSAASTTPGRLWGLHSSDIGEVMAKQPSLLTVRLKVTNNALPDVNLALLVCRTMRAGTDDWVAAGDGYLIKPEDFGSGGSWQEFNLMCDFRPDDVNQFIGIDNFVVNQTDLSIDYFRLVPATGNVVNAECISPWNRSTTTSLVMCEVSVVTPWPALLQARVQGHIRTLDGNRCTVGISIDGDLPPRDLCCTDSDTQVGVLLSHATEWSPGMSYRHKTVTPGTHKVNYFLYSGVDTNTCSFNGSSLWVTGLRR